MSYKNLAAERRSPSSDEFEVADDKTVSFHAPILLEEMANRNFEGPPHATSGSSKTATQSCIASLLTQKKIIGFYVIHIECALESEIQIEI